MERCYGKILTINDFKLVDMALDRSDTLNRLKFSLAKLYPGQLKNTTEVYSDKLQRVPAQQLNWNNFIKKDDR